MATGQAATPALVTVLRGLFPTADWSAVPALGGGQNCTLALDAAGVHPRLSGGTRPTLRVDGEPGRILDALAPRLPAFAPWLAGILAAAGMAEANASATADRLAPALLLLLRQVDRTQVWVLTEGDGAGFDAELRFAPTRGSWLEQVVQSMGRDVTRVPVGRGEGPVATLRVGALRPNLVALLRAFAAEHLALSPQASALLPRDDLNPETAWMVDAGGGLTAIARVTNRAEVERSLGEQAREQPATTKDRAPFEHRGVSGALLQASLPGLGAATPAWHALVAEWLLTATDAQRLRALIDDALDGRVRATPLADGALLQFDVPVATALRGGALPLPARLQITVTRDTGALVLRVRAA